MLRDLQALATQEDGAGDGSAAAGDLRARPTVGVPAAAPDLPEAPSGRRGNARGAGEVAGERKANPNLRGLSRRMWLVMLEHGGRWTCRELADRFGLTPEKAESLAGFMVRSKIVKKVRSGKRKNGIAFAVTSETMIPRDTNLGELLKAAGIRMWDNA